MGKEITVNNVKLSNGETLGYRECGEGDKILLLIHGNMTSSKHWDVLMERLMERYKIYAVDLRGFGLSSYNEEINSLKDFSEDVKLFVDALGISKCSVAGWSTGGGVAMQLAADYPKQIEKLILIESVDVKGYPMFKKGENGEPIVGEFLNTKEAIAMDPIQVAPVLAALKNKDKEFYRTLWNMVIYTHIQPVAEKYEEYLEDMLTQRNLVDVDYALVTFNITRDFNGVADGNGAVENIVAPTLVIQGDRDYVVPRIMGESIAKHINGATFKIFENCGHSPLVDCLDKLTEAIIDFI